MDHAHEIATIAGGAIVGALIGIGEMLADPEDYKLRRYVGKGLVSGGLGTSSGLLLLPAPDAPTLAVVGASAIIATLGSEAVRDLAKKLVEKRLKK